MEIKDENYLVPYMSKIIINYIEEISLLNEPGKMTLTSYEIENEDICVLVISVPNKKIKKYINLKIQVKKCDMLYAKLFDDILLTFLEHETIGVSKCVSDSISAINALGIQLKINFEAKGKDFEVISNDYNNAINKYVNRFSDETSQSRIGNR